MLAGAWRCLPTRHPGPAPSASPPDKAPGDSWSGAQVGSGGLMAPVRCWGACCSRSTRGL